MSDRNAEMAVEGHPVYEFRPLPTWRGPFKRYADGTWVDDDGEYDIAFIATEFGPGMVYGVDLPHYDNLAWSWLTTHWTGRQPRHPRGNPWHYTLRDWKVSGWGKPWGRDRHPNIVATKKGMDKVASERGCASGRGPKFHLDDPVIRAGLMRRADTKEIVVPPERPLCMYCGHDWEADLAAAGGAKP